jgi:glycosyltransferase involved in cell wall biosynthesis
MQNTPLISIALCTYNGEKFLAEQLDSIVNQTYQNIEIVVVDDNSADLTMSILTRYASRFGNIKIYRNINTLGCNKNFERALGLCSGEFIAISDQDDVWHQDKIKLQVEAIKDHELIYHDSDLINDRGEKLNFQISDKFNFYRGDRAEVFTYMNCVSGHSILMKKSLLKSVLPFPEGFYYDHWIAFIAADKGSIDFLQQSLVSYRQHEHTTTDILNSKKRKSTGFQKIDKMFAESEWLRLCAENLQKSGNFISRLCALSIKRNSSFIKPAYGLEIWRHRDLLFVMSKKSLISMAVFALRKSWGVKAKQFSNAFNN